MLDISILVKISQNECENTFLALSFESGRFGHRYRRPGDLVSIRIFGINGNSASQLLQAHLSKMPKITFYFQKKSYKQYESGVTKL